jgi:hypothetical protein
VSSSAAVIATSFGHPFGAPPGPGPPPVELALALFVHRPPLEEPPEDEVLPDELPDELVDEPPLVLLLLLVLDFPLSGLGAPASS